MLNTFNDLLTTQKIIKALIIMFISPIVVAAIITGLMNYFTKRKTEKKIEQEKAELATKMLSQIEKEKASLQEVLLKEVENTKGEIQMKLEQTKANYQKEFDIHRAEIEKQKAHAFRYSEHQFKLYNTLWGTLIDLKVKADDLWNSADARRFNQFVKQLIVTKNEIEKSRLIIEENHYKQLQKLIEEFAEFRYGKESLLTVRNSEVTDIQLNEIHEIINRNERIRFKYLEFLEHIGLYFRGQIKGE